MVEKLRLSDAGLPRNNWRALRVLAHMHIDEYRKRLAEIVSSLKFAPNSFEVYESGGQWYIFLDYGASILGVAHLDTVVPNTPQNCFMNIVTQDAYTDREEELVFTPFLDDRLGVYVLLYYLQQCFEDRFPFDILLTIDEETGRSSASHFKLANHNLPEGRYKWGFQFDATGGGVAKTYAYHDTNWHKLLEDEGWKTEYGSFTDICSLQHLGVKMVNISCGYYKYHAVDSFFKVSELDTALVRFIRFYDKHKDTHFPHTEVSRSGYVGTGYNYYKYSGREWDDDAWYGTQGASTSKGKSWQRKGSAETHTQYRDGRPLTMSWMREETEQETWISYEEEKTSKLGEKVTVLSATHFNSGATASKCAMCKTWHWQEELNFDNGFALCAACSDMMVSAGLVDYEIWMSEGGIVKVDVANGVSTYKRHTIPQDKVHTSTCSMCGQPDWKDVVTLEGYCRWCEAALKEADNAPNEQLMLPLPAESDSEDTRPIQTYDPDSPYDEQVFECYCGREGTKFSGATNTWYCSEHFPMKRFPPKSDEII